MQSCTGNQACTTEQTSITLDANWMWVHTKGSYQNCYDGNKWDTKICPDPATCKIAPMLPCFAARRSPHMRGTAVC